jgi:hypothetical protein
METLKFSNLKKPSNKRWKAIADYLLFTGLPALNIFFVAIQPVSPEFTIWAIAGSNLLIALFKGATKFTAEIPEP